MIIKDMTNKETATHLKEWCKEFYSHGPFAWPTDACGYDQHIAFVKHINKYWTGGSNEDFIQFILKYAEKLESED